MCQGSIYYSHCDLDLWLGIQYLFSICQHFVRVAGPISTGMATDETTLLLRNCCSIVSTERTVMCLCQNNFENIVPIYVIHNQIIKEGAAVAEWLSSWLAGQEVRGSIPGLATWIFRDWLSPASKSRYDWNIAKATVILNTTNPPTSFRTNPQTILHPLYQSIKRGDTCVLQQRSSMKSFVTTPFPNQERNVIDPLTLWDFLPSMLTTNPTPQASLSKVGSYSPWAGGIPGTGPATDGMATKFRCFYLQINNKLFIWCNKAKNYWIHIYRRV